MKSIIKKILFLGLSAGIAISTISTSFAANPEEKLISWKAELSLHGIHDYHSLVTFGQKNFKRTVFGRYGKGQAFAKTILGSLTVEHFTNDDLMRVAEKFGWKS